MNKDKVWFVTGASQGLGLTLVKKLLDKGYRVAATSRNVNTLKNSVSLNDSNRFLPLAVNVNNMDCICDAVQRTITTFGQIDVLVNNAGYGMSGTLEETSEEEIKKIFEVNVFAIMNTTRNILPVMRRQNSGYIINISSVAGFSGAPGWSVYSATKAAVTAFSEVLADDVREFGIRVTAVEPSGFRTGFLAKESLAVSAIKIDGYKAVKDTQQQYLAMDGQQKGDPEKAADILIELSEYEAPPLHLFLGEDAYNRANKKIESMADELAAWKATTISADFDK